MPPKKRTIKKSTKEEKPEQDKIVLQEESSKLISESSSTKRKHDAEEEEEEEKDQKSVNENKEENQSSTGSTLSDRMAKLRELKRRRATEIEQGNRRDRNLEFQRSKENPKLQAKDERKRAEALKLLEKQEAEDKGEDYERKQFWKYSAESVEAWERKMAKKAKKANTGFADHTQAAHKKYINLMSDFKPDMNAYNEKKLQTIERAIRNGEDPSDVVVMANSLDYASLDDKPSKQAINKLAEETKKQIEKRETRSRERKEPTDDISWINEKNRVFNQKIARFYDKYTKEIRDNLERGTAL
ncbi:SYF2 splicing factor-domain-containing protein [Cokeromyces recurvatus]|uniref:SYF2 splicing factor-domain-containing protein n=1 Tax=Cokeromyces recurvatus TaxID=90255 RepID=UPI00221F716E|nr:SYF2 splicing factor-domain-containing protein [Cokeromyces recurvatus]KAI7897511.1 SYF2 splicing factor-domain-containing protein [Cokeromyces recurvatus]